MYFINLLLKIIRSKVLYLTLFSIKGGIKAVVWTDVFQTIVIFGALITVIVKGTIDVGGLSEVWLKAKESQRTELFK